MVRRDVQVLEVVLVGLDLGRLVGHEAELAEDPRDLGHRLDARVERAAPDRPPGHGDVDRLGAEARVELGRAEDAAPVGDAASIVALTWLAIAPTFGPIVDGQPADAAQDAR